LRVPQYSKASKVSVRLLGVYDEREYDPQVFWEKLPDKQFADKAIFDRSVVEIIEGAVRIELERSGVHVLGDASDATPRYSLECYVRDFSLKEKKASIFGDSDAVSRVSIRFRWLDSASRKAVSDRSQYEISKQSVSQLAIPYTSRKIIELGENLLNDLLARAVEKELLASAFLLRPVGEAAPHAPAPIPILLDENGHPILP